MITDPLILSGKICPYCGKPSIHVSDKEVYKTGFGGMVYLCRPCEAWVGCHTGKIGSKAPVYTQTESKGRLANKKLRDAKIEAHKYFDNMWKRKTGVKLGHARAKAYKWLGQQLNIPAEYCHIGMMDIAECKQVIELCKPYFKP